MRLTAVAVAVIRSITSQNPSVPGFGALCRAAGQSRAHAVGVSAEVLPARPPHSGTQRAPNGIVNTTLYIYIYICIYFFSRLHLFIIPVRGTTLLYLFKLYIT